MVRKGGSRAKSESSHTSTSMCCDGSQMRYQCRWNAGDGFSVGNDDTVNGNNNNNNTIRGSGGHSGVSMRRRHSPISSQTMSPPRKRILRASAKTLSRQSSYSTILVETNDEQMEIVSDIPLTSEIEVHNSPAKLEPDVHITPTSSPVKTHFESERRKSVNNPHILKHLSDSISKLEKYCAKEWNQNISLQHLLLKRLKFVKRTHIESQSRLYKATEELDIYVHNIDIRFGLCVLNSFVTNGDNKYHLSLGSNVILIFNTQIMEGMRIEKGVYVKVLPNFEVIECKKFKVILNALNIQISNNDQMKESE